MRGKVQKPTKAQRDYWESRLAEYGLSERRGEPRHGEVVYVGSTQDLARLSDGYVTARRGRRTSKKDAHQ